MLKHSGGEMSWRLFREVIKEQLPWISGRTVIPKCRFSGGSLGKYSTFSESIESNISGIPRRNTSLWSRVGLNAGGGDGLMVRRGENLVGLRRMGVTQRPADRAAQHGVRTALPVTDEERRTDEFVREARKKQAQEVIEIEKTVGVVAGESLTATDTELVYEPGIDAADKQRKIAEEMITKSESGSEDSVEGELFSLDEEGWRGLAADSAFPMGRIEKKEVGETDSEDYPTIDKEVSEHGSFKTLDH